MNTGETVTKIKNLNWGKVAANFLLVFLSTIVTLNFFMEQPALLTAVVNALILGSIAACKEYLEQTEGTFLGGLAIV